MAATTIMTDNTLIRLMTWLSPAFPVGAYTYSHGLESAIEQGWIKDRGSLQLWIKDLLEFGAPRNDAIFIKSVFDGHEIKELDELARAFQPTKELKAESTGQGKAFMRAVSGAWPDPLFDHHKDLTYPVAVGLAAFKAGLKPLPVVQAYLHAFTANLISVAVRVIPMGQTDGLLVSAAFEPNILKMATAIMDLDLDDLGGMVLMNDIASMFHEHQHTRLFRS